MMLRLPLVSIVIPPGALRRRVSAASITILVPFIVWVPSVSDTTLPTLYSSTAIISSSSVSPSCKKLFLYPVLSVAIGPDLIICPPLQIVTSFPLPSFLGPVCILMFPFWNTCIPWPKFLPPRNAPLISVLIVKYSWLIRTLWKVSPG